MGRSTHRRYIKHVPAAVHGRAPMVDDEFEVGECRLFVRDGSRTRERHAPRLGLGWDFDWNGVSDED